MSPAICRLRSRSLTCDHFATLHWGHDFALQLIELSGLVEGSQLFVPVLHVTGRCWRPSPQVTEHWKVTDKRTVILTRSKVDPLVSHTTVIPHRTKVIPRCNRTTVIPHWTNVIPLLHCNCTTVVQRRGIYNDLLWRLNQRNSTKWLAL